MPFSSDMQVLTLQGWREWSTLKAKAKLAVPDPASRTFKFEEAPIEAFQTDEPMQRRASQHIEFAVTADHQMRASDAIVKAAELSGEFTVDTLAGYRAVPLEGPKNPAAQLAGFWLGDGYKISKNRIGFGLKKDRKKAYLRDILTRLGVEWSESDHTRRPGYRDFVLELDAPDGKTKKAVETFIHDWQALAKNKHINRASLELDEDGDVVRALFDALMHSDGHVKQDRPQLQFTSTSNGLHSDFQLLSAMLGRDSHFTKHNLSLSYNPDRNQSFSIKAGEVSKASFEGAIYGAKTSNGLLFVRGNGKQFGFVAGCC
jgi:hypothetical protein